jgi:hypothetical protein
MEGLEKINSRKDPMYVLIEMQRVNSGFLQTITLMTLLRIPYFGQIGSTKLVLPKWQNIDILIRDNRVT